MPFGRTPLHIACRNGESVASHLPSPDLNTLDDHGFTPLYHACNLGNVTAVTELLSTPLIDVLVPDLGGLTCFHIACYTEHATVEIVGALLDYEPQLKGQTDSIGKTGMDWARDKGRGDIVEYLASRYRGK